MRIFVILLTAGFAVALIAGVVYRLVDSAPAKKGRDQRVPVVPVEVEEVVRGTIEDARVFTGSLAPRARFAVAPKIAGRLEALGVNIGDAVAPGILIMALDDEEYVQTVAQARATRDVAEATVEQQATALELARRDMERIRALRDKKIASESEWDSAEAEHKAKAALLRVAQAQMAEKASALRSAEVRLSYTRIEAGKELESGSWRVEDRYVDVGAMLAANTPVISLVDLSTVTAEIHVIERDYSSLSVGLTAELSTDAFPGRVFAGTVKRIAPALRESSRQARVEVEVDNADGMLRPGMFVRVRMVFARKENVTVIPRTAFVRREGNPGVFLLDRADGGQARAKLVFVTPGIEEVERVEILEPALEGKVVTLGHHLLSDGTAIDPHDSPGSPALTPTPTAPAMPDTGGTSAPLPAADATPAVPRGRP